MVHCVAEACRMEIDPSYAFCPYCATDNRPPEERPPVAACATHAFMGQAYCVVCGEPRDEPYHMSSRWRLRLAMLAFVVGLFLVLFGVLLVYAKGHPDSAGGKWAAAWFDNPVTSYGRYGHS